MKRTMLLLTPLLLISSACKQSTLDPFAAYSNSEPVLFAYGTLSTDSVQWGNSFSGLTNEIYFTRPGEGGASLYSGRKTDSGFEDILPITFSLASNCTDVFVTADGQELYFSSNRTQNDTVFSDSFEIWHARRNQQDWQVINQVEIPLVGSKFYPTLDRAGNLFFSFFEAGATSADLYYMNLKGESKPQKLPDGINTFAMEGDPYISQDGSYLIFAAFDRPGSLGKSDLYVSVKANGAWGEPKWLGDKINSMGYDGSPFVTENGKHLIFTSSRGSKEENIFFNHYIVDFDISDWNN